MPVEGPPKGLPEHTGEREMRGLLWVALEGPLGVLLLLLQQQQQQQLLLLLLGVLWV